MNNLLTRFNVVAVISGILISLILVLILKFIIGELALWLLPIFTGFITVFFANETEAPPVILYSIIAGLFTVIWVGPFFLILAPLGGCFGAIMNSNLLKNRSVNLSKSNHNQFSRVISIENWIRHPQTNKFIPFILTLFLGIILVLGIGLPAEVDNPAPNNLTVNNTNNSSISPELVLENNVKEGVELFFKDFNQLFNYDGKKSGYIIETIEINRLNKISNREVNVTVSLKSIDLVGEEYDSIWSGPFYLEKGKWVDEGDFVQIHLYNINTGEKVV